MPLESGARHCLNPRQRLNQQRPIPRLTGANASRSPERKLGQCIFCESRDVRAVGMYKPKPYWEPESQIFNLARMDVLARDVTLTDDMRIPARILDDIRRQYDIE